MQADAAVARKFLLAGATVLPVGIALAAIGQSIPGSMLSVVGLAVLIAGLHTFGRAGPDPACPQAELGARATHRQPADPVGP